MKFTPLILLLFFVQSLVAQSDSEKVLSLKEGQIGQAATITDMSWLAGNWIGEGFGGQCEESWRPPSGGNMLGMFKYNRDSLSQFFELMTITEKEGSLSLLVKHFNADDFSAWEEKAEYVEFPLVKLEENKAWFDGLTFYKLSEKRLNIYLRFKDKEAVKVTQLTFQLAE
jgi:hypothetical protein